MYYKDTCNNLLNDFSEYKENWNNNGAKPFNKELIDKCREFVNKLEHAPEVFPVANNSIQFEFDKSDGSYLKVNIFDDRITAYNVLCDKSEYKYNTDDINEAINIVNNFYDNTIDDEE